MPNYRIIKDFSVEGDYWYKPQVQKCFLFWKYWYGWTKKVYEHKFLAQDAIDTDKKINGWFDK